VHELWDKAAEECRRLKKKCVFDRKHAQKVEGNYYSVHRTKTVPL
jgi:hypothetical protein